MDELDCNPFYLALQDRFKAEFEVAQLEGSLICIPSTISLRNVEINEELIKAHLMKPSPYFKDQYVNALKLNKNRVVSIERNEIQRLSGFADNSNVKILEEELGYNKKGKSFRIFLIEKPLDVFKQISTEKQKRKLEISQEWIDGSAPIVLTECKKILEDLCNGKALVNLDIKLSIFVRNYLILPQYLDDASVKVKAIVDASFNDICKVEEPPFDFKTSSAIYAAVEGYVIHAVHSKLFPVVCQRFREEDQSLSDRLQELHQLEVTPSQLGADPLFSCSLPATIVELATLDSLTCPRNKIQCLKNVIDLIVAEVKQNLQETQGVLTPPGGLPCLTSDDLIPVLLTAVVGAKLQHFASNIYYVEHFLWSVSSKDAHSYSLVTFKATMEFLKTLDITQLKPQKNTMKKELSLEELMQVTEQLQTKTISSKDDEQNAQWTPVDRQMERIARMIEASTRELSSVRHHGVDTNNGYDG